MIRFEAVSAAPHFPAGGSHGALLLRDLDLDFAPGESHLIIGANGSGKTTLLRVLAGLLPPASGRVLIEGKAVGAPGEGLSLWPDLAILFEEPDPQFLTDRVEAEVSFGLESLALPSAEIRDRAAEAMASFGLRGFDSRTPQSLSAGEKARTLLAATLAGRPRALALDQSLAHLDPASRREIESGIVNAALAGERVVIRTHQDADPPFRGERLWVLHQGTLTDAAGWSPDAVLMAADRVPFPLAMRVSSLLAGLGLWAGPLAMRLDSLASAMTGGGASTTFGPGIGDQSGLRGRAAPGQRDPEESKASAPGRIVLVFDRVGWTPARAPRPVLRDIGFELRAGEIVALVGASGSGKTTVLKLAAGLLSSSAGTIRTDPASGGRTPGLALEFPERQLFGRTVLEDVAAALWVRGAGAAERRERGTRAMMLVGLDPARFADRVPPSLSEGEKRRAAIAGFLVDPPPALLLDEPTAGLDPGGRRAIAATLRRLAADGTAVLFASHDLDFVLGVADRAIVVGRDESGVGRILAENRPSLLWRDLPPPARALVPAPDALEACTLLRGLGFLDPSDPEPRNADSLLAALSRSLAPGGWHSRARVAAAPEATSTRG